MHWSWTDRINQCTDLQLLNSVPTSHSRYVGGVIRQTSLPTVLDEPLNTDDRPSQQVPETIHMAAETQFPSAAAYNKMGFL